LKKRSYEEANILKTFEKRSYKEANIMKTFEKKKLISSYPENV
jgi:hypothetical protein